MSDYAIGDLQGCYEPLQRLLEHINFDEQRDRLWFVGDLVNRGPDSLKVLRFIRSLPLEPRISLGNHDLHLLSLLFGLTTWKGKDDTLDAVLQAPDAQELGHWLRKQGILHEAPELNLVMTHAGLAPLWDLEQAKGLAQELEEVLVGADYQSFLGQMYGNQPDLWSEQLSGIDRLRAITNYFTRMRFCDRQGRLKLDFKGRIDEAPPELYPWYEVPERKPIEPDIVFGHWAALRGQSTHPRIHALDTGCFWGGSLTALCLQDRKKYSVPGLKVR